MPPSRSHEEPLVLLSESEAASRAVWGLAVPHEAPTRPIEVVEGTASQETIRAFLPDRVFLARDDTHTVVRAAVVEAQLQWDPGKLRSWCAVIGVLSGQYACPVDLVVLTGSTEVARRLGAGVRFGTIEVAVGVVTTADLAQRSLATGDPTVAASLAIAALNFDRGILTSRELRRLAAAHNARGVREALGRSFVDALYGCAERRSFPDFQEIEESLMLDITMFEDGSIMASSLGRRLLREFEKKVRREAQLAGKLEGQLEGERMGKLQGQLEARLEGQLEGRLEGKLEGKLEGRVEGERKGELAGKRDAVFLVLELGGVLPSDPRLARLAATSSIEALDEALRSLVRGVAIADVLAALPEPPTGR